MSDWDRHINELGVMQKMNRYLSTLVVLGTLTACDPIYVGELRNNKDNPIEIKVCGHDLSYVNYDNSGIELQHTDTLNNCKIIKLGENQAMPIVTASGIATPITYDDLGFNEIEISTNHGQIRVTGQEVMNLFKIEKKRNFLGIHTYDLYYIKIGQKKEK